MKTSKNGRHKKFSNVGRNLTEEINRGYLYKTDREIDTIILHCSASPQGRGDDAHTIDRWHTERFKKRRGIGYHLVILEDGSTQKGAWLDFIGAHTGGQNNDSVGIMFIGGVNKQLAPEFNATPQQIQTLKKIIKIMKKQYKLKAKDIKGHNEFPRYKSRGCPMLTDEQLNEIKEV